MKLTKAIFFLNLYFIFTVSFANEKSKIINKLHSIDNIQFDFIQKTNEETEKGKCILVFPSNLKCNYEDKNQKELVVNKKTMAITQKRYGKTLFYPLAKSNFVNILSKDELIEIIKNNKVKINDYINIVYINQNNTKTFIKFDKKDFILAGWESSDQYNNQISFKIKIVSINQMIDDKIFTLPKRN